MTQTTSRHTRPRHRSIAIAAVAAGIAATACHRTTEDRYAVTAGPLTISNAYLVAPVGATPAVMYFTVRNAGAADMLTGVRVVGVANAELHMEMTSNAPPAASHPTTHPPTHPAPPVTMTTMVATPEVPVPAGGELHFAPGGRHVMLMGLQRRFRRGDSTEASLTFTRAGSVRIPVRVIDYSQLDTLIPGS